VVCELLLGPKRGRRLLIAALTAPYRPERFYAFICTTVCIIWSAVVIVLALAW